MTQISGAPEPHNLFRRRWSWWWLLAVLVLVAVVRIRLLNVPLERDEGEYAYAGQLMLEGIPPYQLAYNMKFPGTYAAYAVLMSVFGQSPSGIHLGVLCVTTLIAVMLYWLGRRILDDLAGLVAASAYSVMAASPGILGLEGHAAHFTAFFAVLGLCCLLPGHRPIRWLRSAIVGGLFGLATLMIQHGVFFCLWGLIHVAMTNLRRPDMARAEKSGSILAYCAGTMLPLGVTCLFLWHAGVLGRFWFWTVSYARQYVSLVSFADAWMNLFTGLSKAIGGNVLLWMTAIVGIAMLWRDKRLRPARAVLLGFAVATFLATCPGFYFRPHYFLVTLPAVALLAGCCVGGAEYYFKSSDGSVPLLRKASSGAVYLVVLAVGIVCNRHVWFEEQPEQASRTIYGFNLFSQAQAAAAFIQTNTAPDVRLAVLGSEPEIYFLSHRRSATGYLYTYALMEPQPFARQMQKGMIQEIEAGRPGCVAVVTFNDSWISRPDSDHEIFDWWDNYRTNYSLVHSYPVMPAPEGSAILVYERRKGPSPAIPGVQHD